MDTKISYSLGMSVAQNLKSSGIEGVDVENFVKGFTASLNGETTEISGEESGKLLQAYFTELQAKQEKAAKHVGTEFLAANAKNEGVVTLESGLQYQILTEGTGVKPAATDQVKCHYHGTLLDGVIFDSSVQRNEPATFPVNGVIPGWVEALQLMPVGSKWKLFIPSDLAYGAQGAGQAIAPHSTLVFEVELLEIV